MTAFANAMANEGLVHLYSSGHSVLPCQEAFAWCSSCVGFNPLTDLRTMWHNVLGAGGVCELLWLERTENYVDKFLPHQPLNAGDGLVVYSHSGRNAAGIDASLDAKKRGLFAVAVSCATRLDREPSHSSGKRLPGVAGILTEDGAPIEDAIVPIDGWTSPMSGSSTVPGVDLADTDRVYGTYRQRMLDAQVRRLPSFTEEMGA